jgi:NAD(P)-dependent dehydrogenase (short-subunit alcohol dehydrogenase family)
MPRLEEKIAVITGGSSGIGLATAKRFVKEGAYVFITGRRQAELDKAAAEIGSNVTAVKGDVANPNDLDRLYQTVAAKKGKLDILFANAGIADPVPTPDVTTEHYDKTFGVNARGVYFTVQKALPLMKDGGSIIVNGSGAWQKGIPMYSTYSATKAALRSFVRTWTAELAGKGIRANMVSPGPIETPLLEAQFGPNVGAMKDRFIAMTPNAADWTARRDCLGRCVPGVRRKQLHHGRRSASRRRHGSCVTMLDSSQFGSPQP